MAATEETFPTELLEPIQDQEELTDQEPDVDQLFQEFWDDTGPQEELVVDVYRRDDKGQLVYCSRFQADEFSLEELRKRHGGGKYQCRARVSGSRKSKSKTVVLEGKPKAPAEERTSSDERSLLEVVTDTQQAVLEALGQLRNPQLQAQANQVDPISLALSIMGAMQQIMSPYQEALLRKDQEAPSFDKFIEAFREGMTFANDMAPSQGGGYDRVITSLGIPLLQQLQEQGRMERTAAAAPPQLTPPTAQAPTRPPWDLLIGPYVATLQGWARKDKDAQLRAELVADELPAEVEERLVEQLVRGSDFLVEFFTLHPEARPYESWYRSFWGNLAAIYLHEDDDDDDQEELVVMGAEERPPD